MKLAIITHVEHIPNGEAYYGYSAYVREMNIWGKFASHLIITAPRVYRDITDIHLRYSHRAIELIVVPAISFMSLLQVVRSFFLIPVLAFQIWKAMRMADHIHLRCPGTIGLMGCMVQVLFPKKPKTAKYAGNWDPDAKQPMSYRFQKWLLANTFWTKNMKVLVYGEWPDQSKNIKSFFTATYTESMIADIPQRQFSPPLKFLFVGTPDTWEKAFVLYSTRRSTSE